MYNNNYYFVLLLLWNTAVSVDEHVKQPDTISRTDFTGSHDMMVARDI